MQITATDSKSKVSVTVEYNFGETLQDRVNLFTEKVVDNHALRSFIIALQGFIRSRIKKGKSAAEIQDDVNNWKPGEKAVVTKDPKLKILDLFAGRSEEEQMEIIRLLREEQKAKKQ